MIDTDRSWRWLLVAIAAAVACAWLLTSAHYAGLLAYAAVLGLFALSVNLVFGTLGYVTFGHAAFLGLGAYTAGLLANTLGWNFWVALPIALIPGVILGAVVGLASVRLGGAYFAIATLTAAEILRLLASNWIELTRGPMGVVVMAGTLPGHSFHGINAQAGYLGATLVLTAVVIFVLFRLQRSPFGRAWTAIRQSMPLAESLGIATLRYRVGNVALSGGIAALAGTLLVPKILVLTPDLFGPAYSATGLLAVILGGRGTLLGPLIGGAFFAVFPEWLRFLGEFRLAAFALILLLVVRLVPGGAVSCLPVKLRKRDAVAPVRNSMAAVALQPRAVTDDGVLLEARGISKSFRGLKAVSNASFKVKAGEVVGLIGPNGAGKTTTVNLLSGFVQPDTGTVTVIGEAGANLPAHVLARRGLVRTFQQTTLFLQLSAFDNVLAATHLAAPERVFPAILRTRAYREREARRNELAWQVLERVGLGARANAEAGSLAYGEQRMLAIAMALAAGPRMLLLDEPAAGLNPTEAEELATLVRSLRDEGFGILIIDHNLKMMMALCDRVVVLHHGEKLADGTPQEVVSDPQVIAAYMGGKAEVANAAAS